MKNKFAIIAALVLASTSVVAAYAVNSEKNDGSEPTNIKVTGSYIDSKSSTMSVDVEWEEMNFTYFGCHLLLVFDAYKVKGNAGKRETFHNIEVVYTKQDETADAFIEKTVFGIRDRYKVTVATSDGLEQQTVMSLGALRMSARELKEHIDMTKRAGMEAFISG